MQERERERAARFALIAEVVVEPVRRFLRRRTDADTADDVLSETLLVCWRRLDEMPSDPLPWTYVVARNCLANATRTDLRHRRLVGRIRAIHPPSVATPTPETPDDTMAVAIGRLKPIDAEVLRLWAWEDLGPEDIATVLGISANAASIRLHRAKTRLRDAIGKADPGAGNEQDTERSRG